MGIILSYIVENHDSQSFIYKKYYQMFEKMFKKYG